MSIRALAAGYVVLAAALAGLGRLAGGVLLDASPVLYAGLVWLLGPLAFALNLGAGIAGADMVAPWLFFFLVASALLAAGLALARRPGAARAIGIVLVAAVWLGSGFLNFAGMLRGLR
jgi:hypothetical protein